METPLASTAPLLAASIMPGPPPEMMPKPASLSPLAMATVSAYSCWSGFTRAEPKMEMQFLSTLFRASKAVTISAMMRNVRQDSVVEFVRSSMMFFCSSGMIFFPCPKVSAMREPRSALIKNRKSVRYHSADVKTRHALPVTAGPLFRISLSCEGNRLFVTFSPSLPFALTHLILRR